MKGTYDRAPARIPLQAEWALSCPWHGRIGIDRCRGCVFLQGTLEGPEVQILCGFFGGAPLRRSNCQFSGAIESATDR